VRGIGLIPLAAKEFLEDIFRSPTLDAKVPNFLLEAHRSSAATSICIPPEAVVRRWSW